MRKEKKRVMITYIYIYNFWRSENVRFSAYRTEFLEQNITAPPSSGYSKQTLVRGSASDFWTESNLQLRSMSGPLKEASDWHARKRD